MEIRRAIRDDSQILAVLNREVQNPHAKAVPHLFKPDPDPGEMEAFFSALLEDEENRIFIISSEDQDLGYLFCQLMHRSDSAFMFPYSLVYVHHIAVKRAFRGTGCGRRLMEAAYQWAREEGVPQVALDVWSFNHDAQRLFKGMGFHTFNLRMNIWLSEDSAGHEHSPKSP